MSIRVTLTDQEAIEVVRALQDASEQTTLKYPVVVAGIQLYKTIIAKLQPVARGPEEEK